MKSFAAGYAAQIAGRNTALALALKVTRTDGEVFGFTSHDDDSDIDGVRYSSSPGLDASAIETSAGAAVGNMELTTLHDGSLFSTAQILGGIWRNAAFEIFRYPWADPSAGADMLLAGVIGEVELKSNTVVAELRDLRQYFQQQIGATSSKACRYRLGLNNGYTSRCPVDLADYTVTGAITAVLSNQVFRDAGRAEAEDYFGEGAFTWLSGANTGASAKVREYAADGTFVLVLPAWAAVEVGDTYRASAGCRKRDIEDCRDKFGALLDFGGEPHRPGIDELTKPVERSA